MTRKWTVLRITAAGKGWFFALGVIVLAGGAGAWLGSRPLTIEGEMEMARHFPLKKLRVEGRFEHVSAKQVRHAVIPFARGGFFGVDLAGAQAALTAMPWVREVRLHRQWPDTLTVRVEEQDVIAIWRGKGLINPQGRLFFPEDSQVAAKWPVVDMVANDGEIDVGTFVKLARYVDQSGFQVHSYSQDSRGAVLMTLNNGVELRLGHQRQMQRLQRFFGFLPSIDDAARIASVDLRYSNGFAVRRRSGVVHG